MRCVIAGLMLAVGSGLAPDFGHNSAFAASLENRRTSFRDDYALIEVGLNYPQENTQNRFRGGIPHPTFGVKHLLSDDWLMGLSGGFKLLTWKETKDEFVLFGLAHDAHWILRLHEPTYLLIGPRISYFVPVRIAKFPLERDSTFEVEIGAAASIMLVHLFQERWLGSMRLDRWRGTKTSRFHGIEIAVGFGRSI